MQEVVRRAVQCCYKCQVSRNYHYFVKSYGQYICDERSRANGPNISFVIDKKSLPTSERGYVAILIVKDVWGHLVLIIRLKQNDQEYVCLTFYEEFLRHHKPGTIRLSADRGSENVNDFQLTLLKMYNVELHFTPERAKESQGAVEIFVKTFMDHFKKALTGGALILTKWCSWVLQLESIYNSLYQEELAASPIYICTGREPPAMMASPFLTGLGGSTPAELRMAEIRKNHEYLIMITRERLFKKHNQLEIRRMLTADVPHFKPNELVLLVMGDSNGVIIEKARVHSGPFLVVNRESTTRYSIRGGDLEVVDVPGYKLVAYEPSKAGM